MRSRVFLIAVVGLGVLLVAFAPALYAYEGGAGSGNRYYDCGGSCHTKTSTATIAMSATSLEPAPGGAVTVTVDVSGGQAGSVLGVMLVSTLTTNAGSLPTSAGWTITSDPSGTTTTYNYYETRSYSGQMAFAWNMLAPSTDGVYTLFARVMHGGGSEYAKDYAAGLTFLVGTIGPPGVPVVIITSPTSDSVVHEVTTVSANVLSGDPINYVVLRIDGNEVGNTSSAPYAWTVDTATYADGEHTVNITAVSSTGGSGSSQVTFTIDNAAENTTLLTWVWTMAAGSVAIVALISVLIVIVLAIRKKKVEGRLR